MRPGKRTKYGTAWRTRERRLILMRAKRVVSSASTSVSSKNFTILDRYGILDGAGWSRSSSRGSIGLLRKKFCRDILSKSVKPEMVIPNKVHRQRDEKV